MHIKRTILAALLCLLMAFVLLFSVIYFPTEVYADSADAPTEITGNETFVITLGSSFKALGDVQNSTKKIPKSFDFGIFLYFLLSASRSHP